MNVPLSTFPAPLLRLILCGGNGLPPAWGPIMERVDDEPENERRWTLDRYGHVINREHLGSRTPMSERDGRWYMTIDDASPWPARLALVAAHLTWLDTSPKVLRNPPAFDMLAASIDLVFDEWEKGRVVALTRLAHRGPLPSVHTWKWSAKTGFCWGDGPRLLTLPEHLQTHPIVALLLSLYDVPEIRARVESA